MEFVIGFSQTICQVLEDGPNGESARAIFLSDEACAATGQHEHEDHSEHRPEATADSSFEGKIYDALRKQNISASGHTALLLIHKSHVDSAKVRQQFGNAVLVEETWVIPISGYAVELSGVDAEIPKTKKSFDVLIPSLKKITGSVFEMKDEVWALLPDPAVIQAYFTLPKGELTAVPYRMKGKLDYTDSAKDKELMVGQFIHLEGKATTPKLKFTNENGSVELSLVADELVSFDLLNLPPENGAITHWKMYYCLSKTKVDEPDLVPAKPGVGSRTGVPGCSNSQYP